MEPPVNAGKGNRSWVSSKAGFSNEPSPYFAFLLGGYFVVFE